MGDGILATFGAPLDYEDSLSRAVMACTSMRETLTELNRRNRELGRPEIRIGMGVHFGEVLVGNIGSTERMQYGVLGDAVNVASRIEGLTKDFQVDILISDEVRQELTREVPTAPLGTKEVKGRVTPVILHQVL